MEKCVICGAEKRYFRCESCGYDSSMDYEARGSLAPIEGMWLSVGKVREHHQEENLRLLRCDKCRCESVLFSEQKRIFRCSRCLSVIESVPDLSEMKRNTEEHDRMIPMVQTIQKECAGMRERLQRHEAEQAKDRADIRKLENQVMELKNTLDVEKKNKHYSSMIRTDSGNHIERNDKTVPERRIENRGFSATSTSSMRPPERPIRQRTTVSGSAGKVFYIDGNGSLWLGPKSYKSATDNWRTHPGSRIYDLCVNGIQDAISLASYGELSLGNPGIYGILREDESVSVAEWHSGCPEGLSKWKNIVSIAVGRGYIVGLTKEKIVQFSGDSIYGEEKVTSWTDIAEICSGANFVLGLTSNGKVKAVGRDYDGQCRTKNWDGIVSIAVGGYHSVGLRSDGSVLATGYNKFGQCNVSGWKKIIAISANGNHTIGLCEDGTVVATGKNDDGSCNVTEWKDIIAIQATVDGTIGWKADGTILTAGKTFGDGQLPKGTFRIPQVLTV